MPKESLFIVGGVAHTRYLLPEGERGGGGSMVLCPLAFIQKDRDNKLQGGYKGFFHDLLYRFNLNS